MQIGNRIFPYPVLNRDEYLSDYVAESVFKLCFDVDEDGIPFVENGEVLFKNLHYTLEDASLSKLVDEGKLRGAFIVECSASVYRKRFDISSTPTDLRISAREINGNVVASCYLYATASIPNFRSVGFVSEYAGYSFDIDKFDILAVDDGFKFRIELDPSEDDKVASIFTVVKKESDDDVMTYANNEKGIVIHLPTAIYEAYDNIKTKREYNNIAFAVLAIPVLASCLEEIYTDCNSDTMEEVLETHPWFRAVCISYKNRTGKELLYDDFASANKLELAQMVLNGASCNGLKDFGDMLLGGTEESGDDDE